MAVSATPRGAGDDAREWLLMSLLSTKPLMSLGISFAATMAGGMREFLMAIFIVTNNNHSHL
jgi:hypothetical protein